MPRKETGDQQMTVEIQSMLGLSSTIEASGILSILSNGESCWQRVADVMDKIPKNDGNKTIRAVMLKPYVEDGKGDGESRANHAAIQVGERILWPAAGDSDTKIFDLIPADGDAPQRIIRGRVIDNVVELTGDSNVMREFAIAYNAGAQLANWLTDCISRDEWGGEETVPELRHISDLTKSLLGRGMTDEAKDELTWRLTNAAHMTIKAAATSGKELESNWCNHIGYDAIALIPLLGNFRDGIQNEIYTSIKSVRMPINSLDEFDDIAFHDHEVLALKRGVLWRRYTKLVNDLLGSGERVGGDHPEISSLLERLIAEGSQFISMHEPEPDEIMPINLKETTLNIDRLPTPHSGLITESHEYILAGDVNEEVTTSFLSKYERTTEDVELQEAVSLRDYIARHSWDSNGGRRQWFSLLRQACDYLDCASMNGQREPNSNWLNACYVSTNNGEMRLLVAGDEIGFHKGQNSKDCGLLSIFTTTITDSGGVYATSDLVLKNMGVETDINSVLSDINTSKRWNRLAKLFGHYETNYVDHDATDPTKVDTQFFKSLWKFYITSNDVDMIPKMARALGLTIEQTRQMMVETVS